MPRKLCQFIEWEAEEENAELNGDDSEEDGPIAGEFDDFINDATESESEDDVRISAREKICDADELMNLRDSTPPPAKRRRVISEASSDSSFIVDDEEDEEATELEEGEVRECPASTKWKLYDQ